MNFFEEVREYLRINHEAVVQSLVDHIWLALLPVAIAFMLSLPIGWGVVRFGWVRHPVLTLSSIITVPSLALLLLLPGILHTSILDPLNVVVALSLYSLALLVRTVVDSLESIDDQVVQSATAMGYRPTRRWFTVDLPLALPVILSGLRVAHGRRRRHGHGGRPDRDRRARPALHARVPARLLRAADRHRPGAVGAARPPGGHGDRAGPARRDSVDPGGGCPMNASTFDFLFDGDYWTWSNYDSFPHRILEHLQYSVIALVIAFAIAFPIGLLIGHTNRGSFLAINIGNAGRALPTLGVLMIVLVLVGTGLVPVVVALVILAIPPILTTTYAGIRSVSGDTVDAARGVGMRELQIVTSVELPIALPIVVGGVRNAVLQVISTATIAAYVGLGGLGRYLFDGLALQDYPRVAAGSVLVALLAVVIDLLLGLVQRLVVSPGVDGRASKRARRRRPAGGPATSALRAAPRGGRPPNVVARHPHQQHPHESQIDRPRSVLTER